MRHGQLAGQFYLFVQTPLDRRGMASLQSNSTFSFKHHLTGEAWPACRAIVPLQTPVDRRGMLCAWSLSIVRTSTIAKNRHAPKHRFASGTVCKNRHLRSAEIKHLRSAEPGQSPGDRRLSTYSFFYEYGRSIDRLVRSGNVGLTHSLM